MRRRTVCALLLVLMLAAGCGGGGGGDDDEAQGELIATLDLPSVDTHVFQTLPSVSIFLANITSEQSTEPDNLLLLDAVTDGEVGVRNVIPADQDAQTVAILADLADGVDSPFGGRPTTFFVCFETPEGCNCASLFPSDDVTLLVPSPTGDLRPFTITGIAYESTEASLQSPGSDPDNDGEGTDVRVAGRVLIFGFLP